MAQQGQEKKEEPLYVFLAVGFLLAFLIWLLWAKQKTAIILLFYGIDWLQYTLFHYTHTLDVFGEKMYRYTHAVLSHHINPKTVSFNELVATQADIGKRTWFLYAIPLIFMTYTVKTKMNGDGVTRSFSLTGSRKGKAMKGKPSFIEFQARYWVDTRFAVKFDPENRPKSTEPPLRPLQWLQKHKIGLTTEHGLDRIQCEKLFSAQIGPKYEGFDKQPFYIKAFLTLCMTTLQFPLSVDPYKRALSVAFYGDPLKQKKERTLEEIERDVMAVVNERIKFDPKMVNEIERIIGERHYYQRTACLGIIGYCGPFKHWGGGYGQIIAPSMYQWIMLYDRELFLALQSHGRFGIKAFIEAAGIISHFQAEIVMAEKQATRFATKAVDGLEEYVKIQSLTDMVDIEKRIKLTRRRYTD